MASSYLGHAHLTEHSADGLNWWAGRRTPLSLDQWGNLIDQWSNGRTPTMYVRQVPERTEVRLLDQNGAPVPGAAVDVYLDYGEGFYVETFNAAPDRTLTADGRGVVTLTRETLLGAPTPYGPKPQIVILGVRSGRGRGFGFIPMMDFNMLFFRQLGEVPPPPPPDPDADAGGGVTAPVMPANADPPPPVPSTTLQVTLHPW